jgi:hypothetical protein
VRKPKLAPHSDDIFTRIVVRSTHYPDVQAVISWRRLVIKVTLPSSTLAAFIDLQDGAKWAERLLLPVGQSLEPRRPLSSDECASELFLVFPSVHYRQTDGCRYGRSPPNDPSRSGRDDYLPSHLK